MSIVKFSEVAHRAYTREDRFNTEKIYYVGGEHIDSCELYVTKKGVIKGSTIGPMFYCGFTAGQILFVTRNPLLKKWSIADFDGICSEKTFVIETKDECITLKELEKHFGVAQATIAGTAARLEKKGMIESFYDPSDKRVKHVRITDKGRTMCVHAGKAMHDKEKWFLSSLSADEKEELHRLLQKVYDDVNNCERKCKKC